MWKIIALAGSLAVLVAALMPITAAKAVELDLLNCQFGSQTEIACDLALKKEVKVNKGTYFDANTVGDAVNAQVGDTITWRITITNNNPTTMPEGDVGVWDTVPSGVTVESVTPSEGTFDDVNDLWTFNVGNVVGEGYINHLPAELVIVTRADTVGVLENRADLSTWYCDGPCEYDDGDVANNSDLAYVNVSGQPQVLGASTTNTPQVLAADTIVDTGQPAFLPAAVATSLIIAVVTLGLVSRSKIYSGK